MALVVQKYGGSSVQDADRIKKVAERIVRTHKEGNDVVVVVSAMGDTTDELLDLAEHGPAYRVGKVSLGAVRDFRLADHLTLGAGGLLAVNFVPDGLEALYGGNNPIGAMGFLRLKLD